jgi:hypothetical protein
MLQTTRDLLNASVVEFKKVPSSANDSTAVTTVGAASIDAHVEAINILVTKLKQITGEVEEVIGQHILAIKAAEPNQWEAVVKTRCGISRSRAYELMAIADGVKTTEQTRRETNARKIKHRQNQAVRSGTDRKDLTAANAEIITLKAGHQRQIDRFQAEIARLSDAQSLRFERNTLRTALNQINALLTETRGLAGHYVQNRNLIVGRINRAQELATSALKATTCKSTNSAVKVAA